MSSKDSKSKKTLFRSLFNIPEKKEERTPAKQEKPKSRLFSSRKFSDEDVQVIIEAVAELQDTVEEQAATIEEQAAVITEIKENVVDVTEIKDAVEEVKGDLESVQEEVTEIKDEVTGGEFSRLKGKLKNAEKKFNKLDAVATKLPDSAPGATSGKNYAF